MSDLKFGCTVEQDNDGDWIICPPDHITIFSVPGEGVLLGAMTEAEAMQEAAEYLACITEEEASC
jgi:hypothetical protein